MEDPRSPQTRIHEGACAIKVSMKKKTISGEGLYMLPVCTDQAEAFERGVPSFGMSRLRFLE